MASPPSEINTERAPNPNHPTSRTAEWGQEKGPLVPDPNFAPAVLNGVSTKRGDQNRNQHRGVEVALSDHPLLQAQALHHLTMRKVHQGPLRIKGQEKT